MKKLLAIALAALLACALALPALAAQDVIVIRANDGAAVPSDEVVEVEDYVPKAGDPVEEIMPISAPIEEEEKELGFRDAAKRVWEGFRAGEFTLWDVLRTPFDILF